MMFIYLPNLLTLCTMLLPEVAVSYSCVLINLFGGLAD